jgi:PAS domain-containing protein
MCQGSENSQLALLWYKRLAFLGVAFLPTGVYALVSSILNQLERQKTRILATSVIGFSFYFLATVTNSVVVDVWQRPWGYHPEYGAVGIIFIAYFSLLSIYIFWLLASGFKAGADNLKRRQVRLFFIALLLGYTGVVDFLPVLGFVVHPIAQISVLFFVFLTAYAVRRYGFLVLERGVALPVIFDAVSNFIIGIDEQNKMSFANRAVQEVLGYDAEIVGQSVDMIFGEPEKLLEMKDGSRQVQPFSNLGQETKRQTARLCSDGY